MKKTLNINLAGYPFTIDEDAYKLLENYLDTIRYAFDTKDDTGELAADIESRIAELLIENEKGGVRIVTFDEISRVIERIGKPSEFIDIDESVKTEDSTNEEEINVKEEKITPPPYEPDQKYSRNPFARKKIFRDPQNAMIGGVCSGIAAYLHIDVTIVRILTVLLFFLSASTVAIIYIILWIVVPEARTPLQRMQMMGEDPTMENIGKTVREKYQYSPTDNYSQSQSQRSGFIPTAISIFVKCLVIIGLIIAFPLIIVLGATLIGCMIAIFVIGIGIFSGGMFDTATEGLMVLFILLAVVGGAITIGVPLWLFIRNSWKKKDVSYNPSTQRAILIVWLCGIAMVAVFTVKAVKKGQQLDKNKWIPQIENLNNIDIDIDDEDDSERIKIDSTGIKIKDKNGEVLVIDPSGIKVKTKGATEKSETIVTDSLSVTETSPSDTIKNTTSIKTEQIKIEPIKTQPIQTE